MTNMDMLFTQIKTLTPSEKQQLIAFLQSEDDTPTQTSKKRVLGLHKHLGKAWMSDDFDDELPDSFWLGGE